MVTKQKSEEVNTSKTKSGEVKANLEEVVYVSWEESEKGWGTRPDGGSLHLTKKDFRKFEKNYWDNMPASTPDEYSRPAGKPVPAYVNTKLYQKISNSDCGLRLWGHEEKEFVNKGILVYGKKRSGRVAMATK